MPKVKFAFIDVMLIALLLGVTYASHALNGDPGIYWHLMVGKFVIANRQVPAVELFLYPHLGNAWVANQWLSDVLFTSVFLQAGWQGLHVLIHSVLLIAFGVCTLLLVLKRSKSVLVASLVVLLVCSVSSVQWFIRPVVFSFLFFALVYMLADRVRLVERRIRTPHFILFPILFLVWANLHPAFVLGLFALGLILLEVALAACNRGTELLRAGVLLGLSALATLINPAGIGLYESIFGLAGSEYFLSLNNEWLSPDFQTFDYKPLLFLLLLFIGSFGVARPKERSFSEWILFLVLLYLTLKHRRYTPFLALAIAPLLAAQLEAMRGRIGQEALLGRLAAIEVASARTGVYAASFAVALVAVTLFLGRPPMAPVQTNDIHYGYPKDALEEIATLPPELSRIFSTPNWGGLITYKLWPKRKAFIDDRNLLNGQAAYETFYKVVRLAPGWEAALESTKANVLFLEANAPIVQHLETTSDWKLHYKDDLAAIFLPR